MFYFALLLVFIEYENNITLPVFFWIFAGLCFRFLGEDEKASGRIGDVLFCFTFGFQSRCMFARLGVSLF